jgi:hypothetical protein
MTPEQRAAALFTWSHPPCGCCDSIARFAGMTLSEGSASKMQSEIAEAIRAAELEVRGGMDELEALRSIDAGDGKVVVTYPTVESLSNRGFIYLTRVDGSPRWLLTVDGRLRLAEAYRKEKEAR